MSDIAADVLAMIERLEPMLRYSRARERLRDVAVHRSGFAEAVYFCPATDLSPAFIVAPKTAALSDEDIRACVGVTIAKDYEPATATVEQ